jgi:hypothetical protein
MFIEGLIHDDKQFASDAEGLSKFLFAGIHKYQIDRPPAMQDGVVTVHVIMAAAAFTLAVVVKDLPRRDRNRIREYLIAKFDDVLREHGA